MTCCHEFHFRNPLTLLDRNLLADGLRCSEWNPAAGLVWHFRAFFNLPRHRHLATVGPRRLRTAVSHAVVFALRAALLHVLGRSNHSTQILVAVCTLLRVHGFVLLEALLGVGGGALVLVLGDVLLVTPRWAGDCSTVTGPSVVTATQLQNINIKQQ